MSYLPTSLGQTTIPEGTCRDGMIWKLGRWVRQRATDVCAGAYQAPPKTATPCVGEGLVSHRRDMRTTPPIVSATACISGQTVTFTDLNETSVTELYYGKGERVTPIKACLAGGVPLEYVVACATDKRWDEYSKIFTSNYLKSIITPDKVVGSYVKRLIKEGKIPDPNAPLAPPLPPAVGSSKLPLYLLVGGAVLGVVLLTGKKKRTEL